MEKQQFKSRIGKKIVSSLVTLLLICTVFLCFSVVVQVLNRGYASIGGYSFFRVVTGSMEPEIFAGELIASKSVDIDTLRVGDVICFRSKSPDMLGRSITHRVIGRSQDVNGNTQLQTKGDANTAVDAYYVTQDNLIGKVVWHSGDESFLSGFVAFFSNKISFLACIALPCLLIAGLIFRDCVKNVKRDIAKAMEELLESERTGTPPAPVSPKREADKPDPGPPAKQVEASSGKREADEKTKKPETTNRVPTGIDAREYEEMYARIRAELIEELKQEYDREQTKS